MPLLTDLLCGGNVLEGVGVQWKRCFKGPLNTKAGKAGLTRADVLTLENIIAGKKSNPSLVCICETK